MRIQLMSDLHFEFQRDHGASFFEALDPAGIDVLVLAGDICSQSTLQYFLGEFCRRFKEVVFVLGNHEYYQSSRNAVREEMQAAIASNPNLHWLDSSSCEIEGVRFAGGTLWFREAPEGPEWALNDFYTLSNARTKMS